MTTFADMRSLTRTDLVAEDGSGVIVGLCDSGINEDHPLLQGKVLEHIDFTGEGTQDDAGHGTAVASIIANIAPSVQFVSCKVLNRNGSGDFSALMRGVEAAADRGASVINMSLAGGQDCLRDGVVARFLDTIHVNDGVMLVAAAGNSGPSHNPMIPAMARSVVAVAALNDSFTVAEFSSRGPACGEVYPDVASFGFDMAIPNADGKIELWDGTSFASPIVAGQLALCRQRIGRSLSRGALEVLLRSACIRVGFDKNYDAGWGLLDSVYAVDVAENLALTEEPDASVQSPNNGLGVPMLLGMAAAGGLFLLASRKA